MIRNFKFCIILFKKNYSKYFVYLKLFVILHRNLIIKLYNMEEPKKYKRKKSLKKTLEKLNEMKKSVPKIIFRAQNLVVTLKDKHQLNRWLEVYPNGVYTINQ